MSKVKRAVVLTDRTIQGYEVKALEYLVRTTSLEIPLLVVKKTQGNRKKTPNSPSTKPIAEIIYETVSQIMEEFGINPGKLLGGNEYDKYVNQVPISKVELLRNIPQMNVAPIRDGNWIEFPGTAVSKIAESGDLIIHTQPGFGLIRGKILTAPTHGVIGFHLSDVRQHRGSFPGYWEILRGDDSTGVVVQRFNESIDGGEILLSETIPIEEDDTFHDVRLNQAKTAVPMLAEAIDRIQNNRPAKLQEEFGPLHQREDVLEWKNLIQFQFQNSIRLVRKLLSDT